VSRLHHVVLSGQSHSGKTTLAAGLAGKSFAVVSARAELEALIATGPASRKDLQTFGRKIEASTKGRWLAAATIRALKGDGSIVVDSARTYDQLDACREVLAPGVAHIHLTAADDVREKRMRSSGAPGELPFAALANDEIERGIPLLAGHADVVIDTSSSNPDAVLSLALSALRSLLRDRR
jgi:hypothetical protein